MGIVRPPPVPLLLASVRAISSATLPSAGARRYSREGVASSYENCLIAEQEGATVGMAHSFDMEEDAR